MRSSTSIPAIRPPARPLASTPSCCADSLHFAEYNAESPAGIGYTQRLCELFDSTAVMGRFRDTRQVRFHNVIDALLDALIASYTEWGGTAKPPTMAIVDWREVPTWTEFEILREAFSASGVPTIVCDPRELVFANGALTAQGTKIDLVYRRVLVNDILARPAECRALVDACAAHAVCMANSFRCKLAHKKAFFAVLTDPLHAVAVLGGRARASSRRTCRGRASSTMWTRRRASGTETCWTWRAPGASIW